MQCGRVDSAQIGMAMTDHLLRLRQKTTEALQALQTSYEAQETIFSQQSMGTKSFTRDLRLLDDKLQAIAFVLRERGAIVIVPPPVNYGVGVTDFSGMN